MWVFQAGNSDAIFVLIDDLLVLPDLLVLQSVQGYHWVRQGQVHQEVQWGQFLLQDPVEGERGGREGGREGEGGRERE